MAKKISKVGLPGTLYQKNKRWWWKVKLPGETRLQDKGLKSKGQRFATTNRDEAEQLALGIWEAAIRKQIQADARAKAREKAKVAAKELAAVRAEADETVSRLKAKIKDKTKAAAEELAAVRAEADETVSRLKAKILNTVASAKTKCEEKLRQCNAVAEQADAKIQAEADKRAALEAEYREELTRCQDALAQAHEAIDAESARAAAIEAECEEKLRQCNEALAQAQDAVGAESARAAELQAHYEEELRQCREALVQAQQSVVEAAPIVAPEPGTTYEDNLSPDEEALSPDEQPFDVELSEPMEVEAEMEPLPAEAEPVGNCECCGRTDVPQSELSTIDSGHIFCAECLASMRG